MSNKSSPKTKIKALHKTIVLVDLLLDSIEEMEITAEFGVALKAKLDDIIQDFEKALDLAFESPIGKSNYLQDLANKVDTVIRKNLKTD